MIGKDHIKRVLGGHQRAYWAAAVMYESALYPPHIVRQGLAAVALGIRLPRGRRNTRQSIRTWRVAIPEWRCPGDLIDWLHSQGVVINEGEHTFYIPPQPALRHIIPSVVGFYPSECGFKILKDLRHPHEAKYLRKYRYSLAILARLIGAPQDQLVGANYMHSLGIGPRVWDLTCWASRGSVCTVFVTEHIDGSRPTPEQHRSFMNRLTQLHADTNLRVLIPQWERNDDFAPPDCNGNLLYAEAHRAALYIDFQNFGICHPIIRSLGLWSKHARRDENGSRGMAAVLRRISCELADLLPGRVSLDIWCRSGQILKSALAAGAAWGIGWCPTGVDTRQVAESLFRSGATRFSLFDVSDYRGEGVTDYIPDHLRPHLEEAVVFWDGTFRGSMLADALRQLPWGTVVCHGTDSSSRHIEPPLDGLPRSVCAGALRAAAADSLPIIIRSKTCEDRPDADGQSSRAHHRTKKSAWS